MTKPRKKSKNKKPFHGIFSMPLKFTTSWQKQFWAFRHLIVHIPVRENAHYCRRILIEKQAAAAAIWFLHRERVCALWWRNFYSRDVTARDKRCMGGGCLRSRSQSCCNQLLIHSAPARLARCRPAGRLLKFSMLPVNYNYPAQAGGPRPQPSRIVSCLRALQISKAWKNCLATNDAGLV